MKTFTALDWQKSNRKATMSKYDPILPLTHTDAYKLGHIHMYPEGTTRVLSNFTDRGSRIEGVTHTVHFGLQAFLKDWLGSWDSFFQADEDLVAGLYEEFVTSILGPNNIGSDHIRALHRLGYLPLRFRSLPEGALVPLRVPKVTVENTHPDFFWLTNYIETALSTYLWQPATSATIALRMRNLLDEWAVKTTGSTAGVEFANHDFSFRGMPGIWSAASSGAGHLLVFNGSDSLGSTPWIDTFYPGDNGFIQGSVPATEHSVATAYGPEDELGYFSRLLDANPTGFLSMVSDSYDLWGVLTNVLPALKDKIMARDGRLVIRPDSGDPVDIIAGSFKLSDRRMANPENNQTQYEYAVKMHGERSPEEKGVFELLWDTFGGTVNEQGYKVLDPHVGVIYGDSITYDRAKLILERLEAKGFAFSNLVFGTGSYTYQYQTRDTFMSAMKATWVEVNGEGRDIYKDPITDSGTKKSARGRIAVMQTSDGEYKLIDSTSEEDVSEYEESEYDHLTVVWEDGKLLKEYSFAEVRANLGYIV